MRLLTFRRAFDFQSNNFHMYMYVFVLLCLLQLAGCSRGQGAAHQGQGDKNCGRHKKFTECRRCDEFAEVLTRDEKSAYEQAGHIVHERTDLPPSSKNLYYFCQGCTKCGDGVLEEYKCTQKSDAVCSNDKCTDETWVFNFVLKACQPPPPPPTTTTTTRSSTVESKVTRQDTASVAADPVIGLKVTEEEPEVGSSSWLQKNSRVIILALIVGVVALFVLVVLMAMLVCRMKRQEVALLGSRSTTPSSSHSSLAPGPAHV